MLRRLLQVMAYRLPMLLLAGRHCLSSRWPFVLTFPQMPIAQRHAMLMSWACSPLPELRQVGSEPEGFSLKAPCRSDAHKQKSSACSRLSQVELRFAEASLLSSQVGVNGNGPAVHLDACVRHMHPVQAARCVCSCRPTKASRPSLQL